MDREIFPSKCLDNAFNQLKEFGYFNDESSKLSIGIQHYPNTLIRLLLDRGYQGKLCFEGGYYPDYGALYWIYDENRISYLEARALTENWVKNHLFIKR